MWRISASKEGGDGSKAAQANATGAAEAAQAKATGAAEAVKKKQQEAAQLEVRAQEKDTSPIAAIGSLLGKFFVSGASALRSSRTHVAKNSMIILHVLLFQQTMVSKFPGPVQRTN